MDDFLRIGDPIVFSSIVYHNKSLGWVDTLMERYKHRKWITKVSWNILHVRDGTIGLLGGLWVKYKQVNIEKSLRAKQLLKETPLEDLPLHIGDPVLDPVIELRLRGDVK